MIRQLATAHDGVALEIQRNLIRRSANKKTHTDGFVLFEDDEPVRSVAEPAEVAVCETMRSARELAWARMAKRYEGDWRGRPPRIQWTTAPA